MNRVRYNCRWTLAGATILNHPNPCRALALLALLLPLAVSAEGSERPEPAGKPSPYWDGFYFKAEKGDRYYLTVSPYTVHFSYDEDHEYVWLAGFERERSTGIVAGFAYFSNSFGQPSVYYYPWGKIYRDLAGIDGLYFKWNAGLAYGYVEPYEDKVPFNYNGFSPGVFPMLGYESKGGFQSQLNLLGTAGLMLQFSIPIHDVH